MNITGLDALVFGVDDVAATARYLTDCGLDPVGANAGQALGGRFEALDGSALVIAHRDSPALPPAPGPATHLRKIVFGVADAGTLEAIATELGTDRAVRRLADGSLESTDDCGFTLGFQVSVRRALDLPAELVNAPGAKTQRAPNQLGLIDEHYCPKPRTLSHAAFFTPDAAAGEAFYVNRLGFRVTDRLVGAGPFLQSGGTLEHHVMFLINTPPHMKGIEHLALHLGGPGEVMLAGMNFSKKGYQSFWGPGRHIMGSNWFWYFNSPLGCRVEYDADMDLLDKTWAPRAAPATTDTTQAYLLQAREKWSPLGKPPENH